MINTKNISAKVEVSDFFDVFVLVLYRFYKYESVGSPKPN